MDDIASIEGVAEVTRIAGPSADPNAEPSLLVEIPHGAESRAEYEALRGRLTGDLPSDLHVFFHVNTDVGASAYGRRVAERVVEALPDRTALVVRSLVPRTFVDVNRLENAGDDLAKGGLTPGIPAYVRDPDDIALLLGLHRAYVGLAERAYERVCGAGGFALTPHTYGPRSMAIEKIDDRIVDALREAHEPDAWARWPVRPEIDFITCTADGECHAPREMVQRLIETYRALGYQPIENQTYTLHPSTQGWRWATRFPDRVLCLEVRRDLLVESYAPFDEMKVLPALADRVAGPLADEIAAWLRA